MAVTDDAEIAERMKVMSLHGLSRDAWQRYDGGGSWDYQIISPGFKYNCTDIAAALGIGQLARAEEMRRRRETIARIYRDALADVAELELPPDPPDRIHAWHLFPIRLNIERLSIDRNALIEALRERGVGYSVHWRPLYLYPYYRQRFGWLPGQLPTATSQWQRLISLPLFPGMRADEWQSVIRAVKEICRAHSLPVSRPPRCPK